MKKIGHIMKNINTGFIGVMTIVATVFVLSSCSLDPIDKTYSKHTADDDFRRIKEISHIDSNDVQLLGKFMIDKGLAGSHILETHATYKDILIEARKEKEKYEIEKRKKGKNEMDIAKSHENDKIRNIKKVLLVDFVKEAEPEQEQETNNLSKKWKKAPAPVENKNVLVFHVLFKNIGQKDIQAFKGDINFYDIFHTDIKKINFTNFKTIAVGDSITQKFTINLDDLNKSTNTYNNLKKEFIYVDWVPDRLIFMDDSVIE